MAGKPKRMSQIKQLLRLHKQEKGKKEIARILGISKNTVKAYLEKVSSLKQGTDALLLLDDPELEAMFHAGNPAYTDNRFQELKNKLDGYVAELKHPGVTRQLLWDEYREEFPTGYRPTQFYHHLSQHIASRNPSMVLQHKPGEKLFVDFAGKKLSTVDFETGEITEHQVFVACMPYSDYSFAMAVRSQSIADFLHALACCLEDFGGVPQLIVPDNLKSAIAQPSRYEPQVNRSLEDFANHHGTAIMPARTYKPKDKALVENQVKLIYTRVYAKLRKEHFFDLPSLNKAIKEKIKGHNQTRMQQKPFSREENFLSNEKPLLGPLPSEKFVIKQYCKLKVAKNNHIYLGADKHYYSVPFAHIGAKSSVIFTPSMVHIYVGGKQVAVHPRNYKPGGYSTTKEHLCSAHRHYLDRSPEYYLNRAKSKSNEFYRLITETFSQGKHPEQLYRTCDGFFNLERKTEPEKFSEACLYVLELKNYSYHFLFNVINKNTVAYQEKQETNKSLPTHGNIRGREYYVQTQLKF